MSWGIVPAAMIGHSIGEYVAACVAGVIRMEDALRLVALRGRLMGEMRPGAMLAVPLPESELQGALGQDVWIAAVNAPSLTVVSPPGAHSREVRKLAWSFRSAGIACARRKTPIKVTSAMTSRPAPREAPANRRSPSLPVEALSPSRFGRPDGPSPGNCEATDAPVMDDTFRGPRQSDR